MSQRLNRKVLGEILWREEHWSDNILEERGQSWGDTRGCRDVEAWLTCGRWGNVTGKS